MFLDKIKARKIEKSFTNYSNESSIIKGENSAILSEILDSGCKHKDVLLKLASNPHILTSGYVNEIVKLYMNVADENYYYMFCERIIKLCEIDKDNLKEIIEIMQNATCDGYVLQVVALDFVANPDYLFYKDRLKLFEEICKISDIGFSHYRLKTEAISEILRYGFDIMQDDLLEIMKIINSYQNLDRLDSFRKKVWSMVRKDGFLGNLDTREKAILTLKYFSDYRNPLTNTCIKDESLEESEMFSCIELWPLDWQFREREEEALMKEIHNLPIEYRGEAITKARTLVRNFKSNN